VLNPAIDDAQVDVELEKISEFLKGKESEITEVQKWGRRSLAYEINKNKEGVYTLIRFNAEPSVPTELDRRYRLNENMLRYLTVVCERPPVGEGAPTERNEATHKSASEAAGPEPAPRSEGKITTPASPGGAAEAPAATPAESSIGEAGTEAAPGSEDVEET
jgi:small subunit ribosomal protein S6